MDRFYIACIIIGALVMIICYLLYDRSGNRRENRNLRASVKCLQGIVDAHKEQDREVGESVLVNDLYTRIFVPEKSFQEAINDALQPIATVDFNEMYKPF